MEMTDIRIYIKRRQAFMKMAPTRQMSVGISIFGQFTARCFFFQLRVEARCLCPAGENGHSCPSAMTVFEVTVAVKPITYDTVAKGAYRYCTWYCTHLP